MVGFEDQAAVDGVLTFVNVNNLFRTKAKDVEELVVWGGIVANCGEDVLAKLVDACAAQLRRVVYCPDRTKGGCLIRPKYYLGNRGGKQTFPRLLELSIRLEPVLLPRQFGWITPALRQLHLLCVTDAQDRRRNEHGHSLRDVRAPQVRSLQEWLSPRLHWTCSVLSRAGAWSQEKWSPKAGGGEGRRFEGGEVVLPVELHKSCPQLECVSIELCSTAAGLSRPVEWMRLLPPQPVPWSISRLLLLPVLKPCRALEQAREEGQGKKESDGWESPLSLIKLSLLQLIFSFLGRQNWACVSLPIPAEEAERLELPKHFGEVSCLDILGASERAEENAVASQPVAEANAVASQPGADNVLATGNRD